MPADAPGPSRPHHPVTPAARPPRRRSVRPVLLILVSGLVLAACSSGGSDGTDRASGATTTAGRPNPDDGLRINQIQVIGTHNSFHVAAPEAEWNLLNDLNPEQAAQRRYSHPPLPTQLGQEKIRQVEFDVFVDTRGGLYADPALRRQAGLPPLDDPDMAKPGIKVLHEQDVDYHSICSLLEQCLRQAKAWSDANPDHVPLTIGIQLKDGPLIFDVPDQAVPEKWTAAQMDALDALILKVFPRRQVITPDDVRGSRKTLNEAVLAGGWPTLGASRGKVMFLMINPEPYRSVYLEGHPGLRGRILFTNAEPGQPDAAYVGLDDAVPDAARITQLVRAGYLVRTRADANGVEAQATDTARLRAALASGAQWIATDYPGPDGARQQYGTAYTAQLPGFLAARCNPVTAPPGCIDARVEP